MNEESKNYQHLLVSKPYPIVDCYAFDYVAGHVTASYVKRLGKHL